MKKDGQRENLCRLLRSIIKANQVAPGMSQYRWRRLMGCSSARAAAVEASQNLLAMIQMSPERSRPWDPKWKNAVQGLRAIAGDQRLDCDIRVKNCQRLAYIAGYLSQPPGTDAVDLMLLKLIGETKPVGIDFNAIAQAAQGRS